MAAHVLADETKISCFLFPFRATWDAARWCDANKDCHRDGQRFAFLCCAPSFHEHCCLVFAL